MVIVWSALAKNELKSAYEYILKDSHQNAVKFRQDVIDAVLSLRGQPNKHRADKYKTNNDGTWRAFEIHHYRVSYRVKNNQIRITRIRHTSRSPRLY